MRSRLISLLAGLVLVTGVHGLAQDYTQIDLKLGGEYLFPREDGIDQAYGGGGRVVFWGDADIGLTFAISGQRWELEDDFGDFTLIPVGMSLALRSRESDNTTFVLEGGARYVFADSNIDGVELDDGIIGVIQADLEFAIGDGIALYIGGGYQFDLSKGDVKVDGQAVDDYRQAAWFAAGGFKLEF